MKAEIKRFHSPDVDSLATYVPTDPENFALLLQVMIGPVDLDGEEAFDVVVCSSKWIAKKAHREGTVWGRHHFIVESFNFSAIEREIQAYVEKCEADDWNGLALLLSRLGKWEFEDYIE